MFVLPYEIGQVAVTLILIMVFALCSESLAPYRNLWDIWISRIGHIVVFLSIFVAFVVSYVNDGNGDCGNEKGYGRALEVVNLCWIAAVVAEGVATVCSGIPITERLRRRVSVTGVSGYFSSQALEPTLDDAESIDRSVERLRFHQGKQVWIPPQRHYVYIIEGGH